MPRRPPQPVLEGRVRDVAHGGDAVIETERGLVFARGALPGERVQVQLERKAAGAQRGKLLEIIERSPARVEPSCPIVERCGGCPLMALAPEAQASWKRERLERVVEQRGYAGPVEWIGSPALLGYRTRARLAWERAGGSARIGYHAAGSSTLVDVERCAVLAPALERGLSGLREQLAAVLQGSGEIALGVGEGGRCVAELKSEANQPPAVYAALEGLVKSGGLAGAALRAGGKELPPARFGDPRQVAAGGDGSPLWAAAGGFTQANPEVNARLVQRVVELAEAGGASVLELFAGHGNFSVALAKDAAELCAVEADRAAADACRENLQARGLKQARVVCDDAAHAAAGKGKVDVVVLDPPRSGAREALAGIVARKAKRIVYVACDLSTLRRDLAELVGTGYGIDAAVACDMFPQTSHLESVVRLVRK